MLIRRSFLIGLASSLTAPAIVHAGNLMPIKPIMVRGIWWNIGRYSDFYGDTGQITSMENNLKMTSSLKPLHHFLDIVKLPENAQWGILD